MREVLTQRQEDVLNQNVLNCRNYIWVMVLDDKEPEGFYSRCFENTIKMQCFCEMNNYNYYYDIVLECYVLSKKGE